MTGIVAGLVLLSLVSVPALTPKATKKPVGAELAPAGTLYSPGVLVGDTIHFRSAGYRSTNAHVAE